MRKTKIPLALMFVLAVPLLASCSYIDETPTNTHYAAYMVGETLAKYPTTESFVAAIGDAKVEPTKNKNFATMEQRLEKLSKDENLPKAKLIIKRGGSFVFREELPDSQEVLYDSEQAHSIEFWENQPNFELPQKYQLIQK